MFKAARWRTDKNRIKAVFKLQFHVTQVPQSGWDTLMVSAGPAEVGKRSVKSEKAVIHNGACRWENPIYETVRFIREPKTGRISKKIYQFLVLSGSSKAGLLGEVSFDFAEYAEAIKPFSVSLPLKNSHSSAVLHVTLQIIQPAAGGREMEENEDAAVRSNRTLQSKLRNSDGDGSCKASNGTNDYRSTEDGPSIMLGAQLSLTHKTISQYANSNGVLSSSSCGENVSASSLDGNSGQDTPKEYLLKDSKTQNDIASFLSSLSSNVMPQRSMGNGINSVADFREHRRSNTEWSLGSVPEGSLDESTNSSEGSILKERPQALDVSVEMLRNEVVVLARQAEVSELELQTLRKQIVKEITGGQDLSREICSLKEERDALKRECERLKASQEIIDREKVSNKLQFDSEDSRYILEEIKQELNYEKDLNANLRLRLQKTQESNSELILAVRDLEDLLEQKAKEASVTNDNAQVHVISSSHLTRCKSKHMVCNAIPEHEVEDKEQHALEVLVKELDDTKSPYSLEQEIIDLCSEIEVCNKDREELEMQMEQLALDYELLKQENHDMSSRLEQSELQEQLKMPYECSASLTIANELEAHVENLEKELQKQSNAFQADLEAITNAKVEQEKRAIRAEEALKKIKWKNASTAKRLQGEFKRLSTQMSSTFDANEKLAMQALTDASELRMRKSHLEDLLGQANKELGLMKYKYEGKQKELSDQLDPKRKQTDQLVFYLEEKSKELENEKISKDEMKKALTNEILMLQNEIEALMREKNELSEQVEQKENLTADMERMRISLEEAEVLIQRGNAERDALEKKIASLSKEARDSVKKLSDIRCLKDEKEAAVESLQSELAILRSQYNDLKHSLFENELEKENLRKQVFQLRADLHKKEDLLSITEKKLKDSNDKSSMFDATTKPSLRNNKSGAPARGSKEMTNLLEKIKVLEAKIELKEAALENSTHLFLKKEKDLCNRIEELEKKMGELSRNTPGSCEDKLLEDALDAGNKTVKSFKSADGILQSHTVAEAYIPNQNGTDRSSFGSTNGTNPVKELRVPSGHTRDQEKSGEILNEVTLLKERHKSMEIELKEMQERYSEISLKFAEVEGERQQLVMTIRNLKNVKKN